MKKYKSVMSKKKKVNLKNKINRLKVYLMNINASIKKFITKHSFSNIFKIYGYVIIIFIMSIFLLLSWPMNYFFDINIFNIFKLLFDINDLPTWISGIASFAAVYVAVMKGKKQETLMIGSNVFISKASGSFIELLNRRTSKGFVRCVGISFVEQTSKIDKWQIIPDFILNKFLSDDWKMFKSVSADAVTKIILNDGSNSDDRLQNIFDFINSFDEDSEDHKRYIKELKDLCISNRHYLEFHMQTNDNARDFYVMVSLRDLLTNNVIVQK